jgi:hypothetical protein
VSSQRIGATHKWREASLSSLPNGQGRLPIENKWVSLQRRNKGRSQGVIYCARGQKMYSVTAVVLQHSRPNARTTRDKSFRKERLFWICDSSFKVVGLAKQVSKKKRRHQVTQFNFEGRRELECKSDLPSGSLCRGLSAVVNICASISCPKCWRVGTSADPQDAYKPSLPTGATRQDLKSKPKTRPRRKGDKRLAPMLG